MSSSTFRNRRTIPHIRNKKYVHLYRESDHKHFLFNNIFQKNNYGVTSKKSTLGLNSTAPFAGVGTSGISFQGSYLTTLINTVGHNFSFVGGGGGRNERQKQIDSTF